MGLFGNSKIDGTELKECLSYFEAQTRVCTFQTKEADLYNEAMVKYGNSIMVNPLAAKEACKAAKRFTQSVDEVLRQHNEIKNIPEAATAMHYGWYVAFIDYAAWASATSKSIEAITEGMNPNTMYLEQLVKQYQKSWRQAENEDKKFVKRLKISAGELSKIVVRATSRDAIDNNWNHQT